MAKLISVKFNRKDWNTMFYNDMYTGEGFIISEPPEILLDGTKRNSLYGPRSPLFGTSYEDEQAFIERYRCECGEFKSRQFEGEECPICHTKIQFRENNLKTTGWIVLGKNQIINPYFYDLLKKTIGKGVFPDIVTAKHRVDRDGNRQDLTPDDFETKPSSPYVGIGIDGFYDDYENIINYFKAVKKQKTKVFDNLLKLKHAVFTSHIPVYTTKLRPQSMTADTFYYGSIDKLINTTYNLSVSLKDCEEIDRDLILQRLQMKVNQMYDYNFDLINGKEGFIREELLGGSLNFTSRNVIIPDPSLRDNEVDISYQTFRELFKNQIIHYLIKLKDCHLSKAYTIWKNSLRFDEEVYQVMKYVLKNETIRLLINRNPTLNYYSMLRVKIRNIKRDPTDYTLSVNLSILPGLNADFDGDILNIIALPNKQMVRMFRKFDPRHRMMIDRDSGKLNRLFMVEKSQMIDLLNFCTLKASECDTPEMY